MTTALLPWLAALALLLFSSAPSAQVYRCGNAYSTTPCAGGKPVDTSPTMTGGRAAAGTATIYLWQSYGGGLFWTREHCAQRDALVERMESVPAGMPFDQQVELASSQRDRSRSMAAQPASAQPQPYAREASAGEVRQVRCPWLKERVRQLDHRARIGGSAKTMDQIAHERRLARDEQYKLRC